MSTWDNKPNDYEHAVKLLAQCRDTTIEECARVAETNGFSLTVASGAVGSTIAAAIRALKDKP